MRFILMRIAYCSHVVICIGLSSFTAYTFVGCAKGDDSTTQTIEAASNISESAMSTAGEHATSSENFSSVISAKSGDAHLSPQGYINPRRSLHILATSNCSFHNSRSTCQNNTNTINWNGCYVGASKLSGSWTEAWSAGFCPNGSKPGILTNSNSVIRTSQKQVLTLSSGATLTTDTNTHTTYDGTIIPNTGIQISALSEGIRKIVIYGLHKIMKNHKGKNWFDHSIIANLSVSGSRINQNRVVNGTSVMFHNLEKYKATNTFNGVTWGSATCCYPTSGSILSILEGSKTGKVNINFNSSCGQATFTNLTGVKSLIALSQCN